LKASITQRARRAWAVKRGVVVAAVYWGKDRLGKDHASACG